MVKKTILIAGGSGNLGSHLNHYLKDSFETISTYFKNQKYKNKRNYIKLNLNNKIKIIRIVKKKKINVIIHTSAITDVPYCEKNKKNCYEVNFEQTKSLVDICKKQKIKLIYISTDAVYDNLRNKAPFKETNSLNHVNYYQFCKVKSEKYILENLNNYLIIRTNPFGLNNHKNSIYWLFDRVKKSQNIFGFYDIIYNPIFSGDLAKYILFFIKKNIRGKINVGTKNSVNKYELSKIILKKFNINKVVKKASITSFDVVKRKLDTRLDLNKLKKIINNKQLLTLNKTIKNFYEFEKKISKKN
jgi:dTDP-4-dehydrorhamnose reductase